jgi:phosphoserine phosphatase
VTITVNTLAIAEQSSLTLINLIAESNRSVLPAYFFIEENLLSIEQKVTLSFDAENQHTTQSAQNSSTLELVVYADTTLAQLNTLVKGCNLKLNCLTAINSRNNSISFRFGVTCHDLTNARKELVSFNIHHKTESALIENAPKLTQPGILLMDMDSTTIKIECIDELAVLAGVGEQVAEVTELAMQGKLDFTQSLYQRVGTLAGSPVSILDTVLADLPLMEGLEILVSELQQHNWRVAIASGGFTYFAEHLKETLNLDAAVANTLEIKDGHLTGKVLGGVVDANVKAETLIALAKQYDIADTQMVAMGDGANDLVMMSAASLGVAFHAKQLVVDQADVGINKQGLDCLLHWLA